MARYSIRQAFSIGIAILMAAIGSRSALAKENVAEALPHAVEAYIYGYPLVTMEMTRRVMTNVEKPEGTRAPMGQFVRMREYPNAAFRDVTAPNADTLYTTAWVDVGDEPWVLSLPDAQGRYYLFPMLDGWTERLPGSGHAHHRDRRPNLRHRRTALERQAARRRERVPLAYRHRLAAGPDLLHRHARGLRRRPQAAGRDLARPLERLRQALHAAAQQGRIPPST